MISTSFVLVIFYITYYNVSFSWLSTTKSPKIRWNPSKAQKNTPLLGVLTFVIGGAKGMLNPSSYYWRSSLNEDNHRGRIQRRARPLSLPARGRTPDLIAASDVLSLMKFG